MTSIKANGLPLVLENDILSLSEHNVTNYDELWNTILTVRDICETAFGKGGDVSTGQPAFSFRLDLEQNVMTLRGQFRSYADAVQLFDKGDYLTGLVEQLRRPDNGPPKLPKDGEPKRPVRPPAGGDKDNGSGTPFEP